MAWRRANEAGAGGRGRGDGSNGGVSGASHARWSATSVCNCWPALLITIFFIAQWMLNTYLLFDLHAESTEVRELRAFMYAGCVMEAVRVHPWTRCGDTEIRRYGDRIGGGG